MKRFTNPQRHSTSLSLHIKSRTTKTSMQAQQSLFQSAFKDPNQRVAHGVKKSIPFLNLWAPSPSVQRYQSAQAQERKMASATSFYDFKPLDSMFALLHISILPFPSLSLFIHHGVTKPRTANCIIVNRSSCYRERPTRAPRNLQRQGVINRQHRLEMRLHAPIRRSRDPLQKTLRLAPRPIHHPGFPLQPIRLPRAGHGRRHPIILPNQLRRLVPHNGEDGCEWR